MDGYIDEVRLRFGHEDTIKLQHSPHKHHPITYSAKAQLSNDDEDTSPLLNAAGIKRVQGIVGCLSTMHKLSTTSSCAHSALFE